MDIDQILKKWFVNPVNPTDKELEKWMKDPDSFEPMQDWDIMISGAGSSPAFVRLACIDGHQRIYMLHCLYVSTGYAFNGCRHKIEEAINMVPSDAFDDVITWRDKAIHLCENPKSFNEKEWFDYMYTLQK